MARPSSVLGGGGYFHKKGKSFETGVESGVISGLIPTIPAGEGFITAGSNISGGNRRLKTVLLCIE
jgi:hypothetical protein